MNVPRATPHVTALPIEDVVVDVRTALSSVGAAVLQAQPGAGKTTIVPLRLLGEPWVGDNRIVLLEPRRVAARAAAARMAHLLGEPVGATVGFSTRDERRVGPSTRIEVVTDGILTRRIQRDPTLAGVAAVIFDEFHERHLQADLGLALTLDARDGLRPDLRVLVMSATIDAHAVAALLANAPVITSTGRTFPVEVVWVPQPAERPLATAVSSTIRRALERTSGDVLVFLPGVAEIRATARSLGRIEGVEVVALHGSLPAAEQDRALSPGGSRRVVLATDLAESSITVEGIGAVVDAGLVRRPAYDPGSGLSRLRTTPHARASADQRAGRAGRDAPGVAYRLWSESEHLARRPWPDPEIATADLTPLALELAVWGAPAGALRWLDPPAQEVLARADVLLVELGALAESRPTPLGRRIAELPIHPRLGRMLLDAPEAALGTAALLAALCSERDVLGRGGSAGLPSADISERVALVQRGPGGAADRAAVATVRRRADELVGRSGRRPRRWVSAASTAVAEVEPGPLLALAYPDRLAQSRSPGRYRLRHGSGAVLPAHDPLGTCEWIVVAEIDGGGAVGRADGRVRLAAALDRSDIEAVGGDRIETTVRVAWDDEIDDLRATSERRLDALVLESRTARPIAGPATTALLIEYVRRRGLGHLGWRPASRALQARTRWASRALGGGWPDVSDQALLETSEQWLAPLLTGAVGRAALTAVDPGVGIRSLLGAQIGELNRIAPRSLRLPGGREVEIDYDGDAPRISVRAQDVFGTTVHPTVGEGRVPVVVELLSPAGRPIQVTSDLPGFWSGSWGVVRREMAVRYPKHRWPDNPAVTQPPPRQGHR